MAATLWQLVQSGSLDKIQTFLATPGVDVNDRYVVGRAYDDPNLLMDDKSLLDFAAEANQLPLANYLVAHGARVNEPQRQGLDTGLTPLHRSAFFNAVEILEMLIAHGANVNAKHGTIANGLGGATPLTYAAANGSVKTLVALLSHGADPSAATVLGDTPLSEATKYHHPEVAGVLQEYLGQHQPVGLIDAARNGELDAVRTALSRIADRTAMDVALQMVLVAGSDRLDDRQKIVQLLIERGAHVNGSGAENNGSIVSVASTPEIAALLIEKGAALKTAASQAAAELAIACNPVVVDPVGTLKIVIARGGKVAADSKSARSMLRCAVLARKADLAQFLIEQGTQANSRDAAGRTLLFDASDAPTVELLVKHGVPVDAVDGGDNTALKTAILTRHTQAAVALVNNGASARTGQSPVLHAAARTKQFSVVKALLAKGADVNARDADGRTALFLATEAGDYFEAQELLEHGAGVNVSDNAGSTPLHVAARGNFGRLVSYLLEQHGNAAVRDKEGLLPKDRATAPDVRTLLEVMLTAWDEPLPPEHAAACAEVARRAHDGSLGHIAAFGESSVAAHDPRDNWTFLEQVPTRYQVKIAGRFYFLGSDAAPVYLSRLGDTGTESVICEFATIPGSEPPEYRVLGKGERLPGDLAARRAR